MGAGTRRASAPNGKAWVGTSMNAVAVVIAGAEVIGRILTDASAGAGSGVRANARSGAGSSDRSLCGNWQKGVGVKASIKAVAGIEV